VAIVVCALAVWLTADGRDSLPPDDPSSLFGDLAN
jgi:hypothetical protein